MATDAVLLLDIGITLVAATFLGFIARMLKQPLILAYVFAGIIVGPSVLGIINEKETIDILAQFGIALLLFMVGLELDIKRLKDVGKASIGCGIGQIITTFVAGLILARFLGFGGYEPFYIAFALTISSTMVVVKLLTDKSEIDTLHGKIVLGTLLVQDIVTIVFLTALPTIDSLSPSILFTSVMISMGLVVFAIFASRFVLPFFVKFASRSVELLFLFSLSWCFIFASLTYTIFLTFLVKDSPQFAMNSISIGAFLAGISLASFPYNLEIVGRIRPLKDFFLTLFFASLGMQVTFGLPAVQLASGSKAFIDSLMNALNVLLHDPMTYQAAVLSLYVLIGATILMMLTTRLFGYGKRTSFMTAISLAQISEFSLIMVVQGQELGHLSASTVSMITAVVVITITISSYFIMYNKQLYSLMLPFLVFLDRIPRGKELEDLPLKSKERVIVVGSHRMGAKIVETLRRMREDFLVVDYNPDAIKKLVKQNIPCVYGDIGDAEILERINLKDSKVVISTIPENEANLRLIMETKRRNPRTLIFIVAEDLDHALELYEAGADYVIVPRMVSGEKASELLKVFLRSKEQIKRMRDEHVFKLEDYRKEDILWRYEPSLLKSIEKKIAGRREY